ncbi:MAG: class I SAM-dependent methyltransferase [bacterium]
MLIADRWGDYELVDAGAGERLERWGEFTLRRPDPQVLWPRHLDAKRWERADAVYHRSASGGGRWEFRRALPERWTMRYAIASGGAALAFHVRPTGFKHTGLFPEQAVNWEWMMETIAAAGGLNADGATSANAPARARVRTKMHEESCVRVLNLFAYTGGATVAATAAGATVCHVDSAKGMVAWAKENLALSGLGERPARFLVDDVMKFAEREKRRGNRYDAIVMDPPSFGRGTSGETWKIEKALLPLVNAARDILSEQPLFFLINSYTTGLSPRVLENVLRATVGARFGGDTRSGEVGLPIASSGLVLPCGIYARWQSR